MPALFSPRSKFFDVWRQYFYSELHALIIQPADPSIVTPSNRVGGFLVFPFKREDNTKQAVIALLPPEGGDNRGMESFLGRLGFLTVPIRLTELRLGRALRMILGTDQDRVASIMTTELSSSDTIMEAQKNFSEEILSSKALIGIRAELDDPALSKTVDLIKTSGMATEKSLSALKAALRALTDPGMQPTRRSLKRQLSQALDAS